jgi:hypothetical protein
MHGSITSGGGCHGLQLAVRLSRHKAGNITSLSQKLVTGQVAPVTQKRLATPTVIFPVFGLQAAAKAFTADG